jgi:hypothetical protein
LAHFLSILHWRKHSRCAADRGGNLVHVFTVSITSAAVGALQVQSSVGNSAIRAFFITFFMLSMNLVPMRTPKSSEVEGAWGRSVWRQCGAPPRATHSITLPLAPVGGLQAWRLPPLTLPLPHAGAILGRLSLTLPCGELPGVCDHEGEGHCQGTGQGEGLGCR